MKAAVFTDIGRIEMQELPAPRPTADQALIRVIRVGVCGSEVHAFAGTHPFRKPPGLMGHELAGEVVEIGQNVTHFRVGDRVTVVPLAGCGDCLCCRSGDYRLCARKVLMGMPEWPGAFAEYVVAPEKLMLRAPESLSFDEIAMCEPLAVGIHATRRTRVALGDSVLVLGAGGIGLCCVAAARAAGATQIVATDAYDYNLDLARRAGAGAGFNVRGGGDLMDLVSSYVRPEGVDVALVAAGFDPVMGQALSAVRRLGRVGLVALFEGAMTVREPFLITARELEIMGVYGYEREDFQTALQLMASGAVDAKAMISHVLPIEEAQHALELVHHKGENVAKVLLAL